MHRIISPPKWLKCIDIGGFSSCVCIYIYKYMCIFLHLLKQNLDVKKKKQIWHVFYLDILHRYAWGDKCLKLHLLKINAKCFLPLWSFRIHFKTLDWVVYRHKPTLGPVVHILSQFSPTKNEENFNYSTELLNKIIA